MLNDIKNFPNDIKKLKTKELKKLAEEIRKEIIEVSKLRSIHLSSNLGIVELSIALLYVFNSPTDQILYDTGHQCYVHKILTGRKDKINTIRDTNGLSGFQDPNESVHDFVSTGHSGNILSIAQGISETCENKNRYFVPVVGDAAISNGLSFEALNNIAYKKTKMVIIFNDNEMSISENVGALYKVMSKFKLSKFFFFSERAIKKICSYFNWTRKIYLFLFRFWNKLVSIFFGKNFFESLGFFYFGSVDGNNIKKTIRAIEKAKWYSYHGPVILHVKTKKGLGLKEAEADKKGNYHSTSIDTKIKDNKEKVEINQNKTFGEIAADELWKLIEKDKKVKVINPAMTLSTGFSDLKEKFENNYEDVGISEEHAVSKASGISLIGGIPFVVIYSTFMQRTYDQIMHDIARINLPVNFLVERSDIAYSDGDTHHGIYDVAFLKTIPNTIISEASNDSDLRQLINLAYNHKKNPFFIRYTKEICPIATKQYKINFGDWIKLQEKNNSLVCLISYGDMVNKLYTELQDTNIDIYNSIFINGFNEENVLNLLKRYKKIYVAEKVYYQNSLAEKLKLICFDNKINTPIISFSIKTPNIGFGSKKIIDEKLGIDIKTIINKIKDL